MPVVIRKDHGQMLIKSVQHSYLSDKLDDAANGKPNKAMPRSVTASIPSRVLVDVLRLRSSANRAKTKTFPRIAKPPVSQNM